MGSGSDPRRQLRQRIAALGPRGLTSRVPDDVRAEIVGYVTERRRTGASWRVIAEEVGFSVGAITGWMRAARTVGGVVPVAVRPAAVVTWPAPGVVIVLPSGVRVEGLHVADVPALLTQLA